MEVVKDKIFGLWQEKDRKIGSNVVKNNESDSKRWNPSRWGTAVAQANSSLSIL